jgi:hypothetical protein
MLALAILAAGHTAATLNRESTDDPKVRASFAAMKAAVVPRTSNWSPRSMADFDLGMNLNLSLTLVTVVALLGLLARSSGPHPRLVSSLLHPILFFTVAMGVTSLVFFAALPAVGLCAVASLFVALALARLRRASAR